MQNNLPYFYAWAALDKITYLRYQKLKNFFGDLKTAWNCSDFFALQQAGFSSKVSQEIIQLKTKINPVEEMEKNQKLGIKIIFLEEQDYPYLLKEIDAPPVFLFYKGSLNPIELCLAVVGSRQITTYGKQVAYSLLREIVPQGLTIISGLALGVDTFAHQEALNCSGRTLAVLGNGLDQVYPLQNKNLAQKIQENGALISEFPIGVPPYNYNFPRRNRLISGLSVGTLVVEAKIKSGSLITARYAIEQNRDVFAVPGNIFNSQSGGTNQMIQKGEAKLVLKAQDILEDLNLNLIKSQVTLKSLPQSLNLTESENKIVEILNAEPLLFDSILNQTKLKPAELVSTLSFLELKGIVRNLGNNSWIKLLN